MIYGIGLTEENYIRTIYNVAELNAENGLILLCCQELKVFDKALRDNLLEVNNNVLLYDLSEEHKIYVKSVKKKEKAFLKRILGEDKLLFPKN